MPPVSKEGEKELHSLSTDSDLFWTTEEENAPQYLEMRVLTDWSDWTDILYCAFYVKKCVSTSAEALIMERSVDTIFYSVQLM